MVTTVWRCSFRLINVECPRMLLLPGLFCSAICCGLVYAITLYSICRFRFWGLTASMIKNTKSWLQFARRECYLQWLLKVFLKTIWLFLISRIEGNHPAINDSVPSKATLELCKISNACPSACPRLYSVRSGATYTISETIHVTVSVDSPIFLVFNKDALLMVISNILHY